MALPIEKLNHDLEGILSFKGQTYSIPFVVPGQLVQFRIRHDRYSKKGKKLRHKGRLEVLHLEDDPHKKHEKIDFKLVDPICVHYGKCGGCRAQHIAYADQFRLKAKPIQESWQEHFNIKAVLFPSPQLSHHRNRMDFSVGFHAILLRSK